MMMVYQARWLFLFLILQSMSSWASMAPSSRSLMIQLAATANNFISDTPTEIFKASSSVDLIYLNRQGPSFGLRYFAETRNELGRNEGGQSLGALIGYFHYSGLNLQAVYDASAKLGTWNKGSGFQADLGYIEHMGSQYHLGLKISYRSTTYKSDDRDSLARQKTVTDISPNLVLLYLF